jgi:tRNA (adenine22-N1)-methyltransferase
MELSQRLLTVANMVSPHGRVADIGCDHGYVSIYLMQSHIADKVIAMDVNEGPLARAKEHIHEAGLDAYIETRLSDGAAALLENEADTAVIAGMGGRLMVRILSEAKARIGCFKELVLQPQSEVFKVRQYLWNNGYDIIAEDMVLEDGKYYQIIKAREGEGNISRQIAKFAGLAGVRESDVEEAFLRYGLILLKEPNPICEDYLKYEQQNVDDIRQHIIQQQQKPETIERLRELEHKLQVLQCAVKVGELIW